MEAVQAWETLTEPWKQTFLLAWESFTAGSPPMGAAVVNYTGDVIARARSRRGEPSAPAGQLAGSRLAHAEINALAQLPTAGVYADHTLYTTLESCALCAAATAMSGIGHVRYAAAEPIWGDLEIRGFIQDQWPERQGPLTDPFADLAVILVIVDMIATGSVGRPLAAFREAEPRLFACAADVVASGLAIELRAMEWASAMHELWRRL